MTKKHPEATTQSYPFIDEIHTPLAQENKRGMDAADPKARPPRRLRCIGATTITEYRRHIESIRLLNGDLKR